MSETPPLPRASPTPQAERLSELEQPGLEHTPASFLVTTDYVKRKLAEATAEGEKRAKTTGLAWGSGVVVAAVGVAFAAFFAVKAQAQELDAQVLKEAKADAGERVSELKVKVEVLSEKVDTLTRDVAEMKATQSKQTEDTAEILRLIRKRDGGR